MPSLSLTFLVAGLISSALGQGNNKMGYSGTLSSLSGGLQGTVTVVDSTTLMISNYELQDASAPALYWWGTTDGVLKDGFRISNDHITMATTKPADMTIKLDAGKTTADFSTVGLWCEHFGINFGQATLKDNGGSNSTTASTASTVSAATASASASTSKSAAAGMVGPSSFGGLAGVVVSSLLLSMAMC
ncbi:hypothetical protein CNMCM7691_001547 [Aspergillus felis]|uniref:DM13 domain-containing protein n=1 Tax=Aspergillus felis TaxID=1287682 RepID=A0A8H6VBJ1_9EURO|nr:hypothetical protein CNMCM7691_001547 [Aspergillus felis]